MNDDAPHADLFQALFETAPDAMVVVDLDGAIVLANPQAERLFGYAPGDLADRPIEVLLPQSVRAAHVAHRTHYMASPRVRPMGAGYELTGVRADGRSFPVEVALSPVAAAGRPLFAASIRDISETKRARQALVRARYDACIARVGRHVLESPHYERAIEAVPELVAEALGVGAAAIVLADPRHAELQAMAATGLDEPMLDVLLGNRALHALAEPEPPREGPQRDVAALLRASHPLLAGAGFADAVVIALPDRHGPLGFLLALAHERGRFDRDAQHFLQAVANMLAAAIQRGRSEEQLSHAQRLDALGQLTGGIAHDFNNLLTVISGNLQLLEAESLADPATRETIESAARAVERGATLTRKLLAFSRRQYLIPRAVRPAQLLGDLGAMLGRTLGERIVVSIECPPDVPTVYADPGELEAALINLALNARDAMPRGGRLSITARTRRLEADEMAALAPGTYVVIRVADTGMGMAPEILARALEPFFTTKDTGKGSGLGLSMVYGFVRQSDGHLEIESQLGYGTGIDLYLPVAATDAPGAPAPPVIPDRGHGGILVVEDEDEVRRIAVAFLHSLGYATFAANDAAAALDLLASRPEIDLLFSDIVLGDGMTGFELAAEARARRPGLPVLFTSGYEYASMEITTQAFGPFQLLRKPYRREQLADALRAVLERGSAA